MTQGDKNFLLLLKDLCARLPYGVMCHINSDDANTPRKLSRVEVDELDGVLLDFWTDREDHLYIQVYLSEVKPYLRPISTMTKEENDEFQKIEIGSFVELLNFLNAHHFDYNNLIEKGLALEAPKDMYNF